MQTDQAHSAAEPSLSQFLTFELGREIFGINILHIREIIEYKQVTGVPMMPPFVAGVINLRGHVVPVVDLAVRFARTPSPLSKRTSIVIVELQQKGVSLEVGLMVDMVSAVMDISLDSIQPAPSFGSSIRTDFIEGIARCTETLLILLNIHNILSVEELSAVVN